MKSSIETFGKVLFSPSQYIIPVFQRHYRWEDAQWEKLWESLEEIQQPSKNGNHFMGFLVVVPGLAQPGRHNTFHVIDGQQRLTSLSLVLAAIRNVADQAGYMELAAEIHEDYLVHPRKTGDERLRILPKERDSLDYRSAIEQGDVGIDRRVGRALDFFERRLEGHAERGEQALRSLFNVVTQRLEFMIATLETENAYNIFKSLNSTGVKLSQADLIRNFVFMYLPPEEHDDFDREAWSSFEKRFAGEQGNLEDDQFSRFFRDYLMSNGEYVGPDETFDVFESRYEATSFSGWKLAAELNLYAGYYEVIRGRKPDKDSQVTEALRQLNALESSTAYPFLLNLFSRRDQQDLSSAAVVRAIRMLSSFILRRYVCRMSSKGYGRMLLRPCELSFDDSLTELNDYLVARGWPDDRTFMDAFVQFPFYERRYVAHVLQTLERAGKHKEPADLSMAQVEHIMPQTLSESWRVALGDYEQVHAEWLHRIGNLTLSAYNAELWNHPFATKKERYGQSNIGLTRRLADYASWTQVEIEARGRELAALATGIWTSPLPSSVPPGVIGSTDLTDLRKLRLSYWTEFNNLVASEGNLSKPRKPVPETWLDYAIGRWEFKMVTSTTSRGDKVSVSLLMQGPNKARYFNQLFAMREALEEEIGEPLSWHEMPNKKSSYISVYRQDSLKDRSTWPELQRWMLDRLETFYRVFRPIVRDMK